MSVEYDTSDEDLRPLSDRVCMMCGKSLNDYIPYRERADGFYGKYVCIPLECEAPDVDTREDLRVCNHWQCVQQAKDFAVARRVRVFSRQLRPV